MTTGFDKKAILAMTDEQLLRFSKILKLTKAVHTYDAECQFVAEELGRRLDNQLKADREFARAFKPNKYGEYA